VAGPSLAHWIKHECQSRVAHFVVQCPSVNEGVILLNKGWQGAIQLHAGVIFESPTPTNWVNQQCWIRRHSNCNPVNQNYCVNLQTYGSVRMANSHALTMGAEWYMYQKCTSTQSDPTDRRHDPNLGESRSANHPFVGTW
jgi:hypothetical protein